MKNHSYHIRLVCCIAIGLIAFLASCKKFIEKQKQNVAVSIVTDGTWRVSRYDSAGTDLTYRFEGYNFQFHENGQVDGLVAGNIIPGTWVVNVSTKSIQASFPAFSAPVNLLNHLWTIKDSYTDSVSAISTADTLFNHLELHKN